MEFLSIRMICLKRPDLLVFLYSVIFSETVGTSGRTRDLF